MQLKFHRYGFTLIEVVAVITILGILAAFAVPRFVALKTQARAAAVEALAGSVRSGAALAHALWLAQGQTSPVTMEGRSVTILNGYPDRATIDDTLVDKSGFTYAAGSGVFSRDGASGTCTVTYSQAPVDGAPAVVVDTSGCN